MKQDLADETADLLGHILLFAHYNGIDLVPSVERKWLFRP
jgi:NTP pyrophosphatase (non-canonical NTP hydrolase)